MLTEKEILEACLVIHLLSVHEFIQQTLSTHLLPGIVIGVEIQSAEGHVLPPRSSYSYRGGRYVNKQLQYNLIGLYSPTSIC